MTEGKEIPRWLKWQQDNIKHAKFLINIGVIFGLVHTAIIAFLLLFSTEFQDIGVRNILYIVAHFLCVLGLFYYSRLAAVALVAYYIGDLVAAQLTYDIEIFSASNSIKFIPLCLYGVSTIGVFSYRNSIEDSSEKENLKQWPAILGAFMAAMLIYDWALFLIPQ